jgi:hypothetical protein
MYARLRLLPDHTQKWLLWWRLFLLIEFAVFFYILMEWLFFVTKPSFMDSMSIGERLETLLLANLYLLPFWLVPLLILFGVSLVQWLSKLWFYFLYVGELIPASILAATSLILIDNFTYTLFRVGVVSTNGVSRILYGLLFLVIISFWYRWVYRRLRPVQKLPQKNPALLAQTIAGIGLVLISVSLATPKLAITGAEIVAGPSEISKRPNILLIGSDGLNANHTSVYGYERDTTPNLRRLAIESLIAENAFTNGANSSGSVISMLTGKPPTETRVVFPPDILKGVDAYQHLPGILRRNGYRSFEIGTWQYMDSYTLNLIDGFDIVNDRALDQTGFHALTQFSGIQETVYFLTALTERLSDRLLHLFLIKEMANPYREVTTNHFSVSDEERIKKMLNYLEQSDQPTFIHVHLMGTHGGEFFPEQRVFSSGLTQDIPWMTDFYDDAILEFDRYVGTVLEELTKLGQLEDTILIIYSDHGLKNSTDQAVPLLIRFPNSDFSGRIQNNVQNMDFAPTILDYLHLPIPDWMEGQSLIHTELDRTRPIFSTGATHVSLDKDGQWSLNQDRVSPPFYQFEYIQTIICQNWYRLSLETFVWSEGVVSGHSAPCPAEIIPDRESVNEVMLTQLASDGFDISDLEEIHFSP